MMKIYVFFLFAAVGLIAQPALANYPCPGGPGLGEQQIGVGGGSHGIAAVPLCVATGGGADSAGGGYVGGYRCDGCNIFADPGPPSYDAMSIAINEQAARNAEIQKQMLEAEANLKKLEADPDYQRYMQGGMESFSG